MLQVAGYAGYAGYNTLGPANDLALAFCWSRERRKFPELIEDDMCVIGPAFLPESGL